MALRGSASEQETPLSTMHDPGRSTMLRPRLGPRVHVLIFLWAATYVRHRGKEYGVHGVSQTPALLPWIHACMHPSLCVNCVAGTCQRRAKNVATAWQERGHDMARTWQRDGKNVATTWQERGKDVARAWQRRSKNMATTWQRRSINKATTWQRRGNHVGRTWQRRGKNVATT